MQNKTNLLTQHASQIGMKVNSAKTKLMRMKTNNTQGVAADGKDIEEVTDFTYLGSRVNVTGGTEEDLRTRIGKARTAFKLLGKVWKARDIKTNTKLKIFNSSVKAVYLYGAETWKTTVALQRKAQSFINNCLRRILNIHWPEKISNKELWKRTNQMPPTVEIQKRRWTWIGHTLRKEDPSIPRHSLRWNPPGKRSVGRPRNTWRRSWESECKAAGLTWHSMLPTARDRTKWKALVHGLCSNWSEQA